MALTLYLIRHGQTAWNVERRMLSRTDIPLDDTGRWQADRLKERFQANPVDKVYSSPLLRAWDTAAGLGAPVPRPELMELNLGELDGMDGPTLKARYPGILERMVMDPDTRPPGGETLPEAAARGLAELHDIARLHAPSERIAVVSHQLVIATVLATLSGVSLTRFREFSHQNTGVTTLRWDGTFRVEAFNDVTHLSGSLQ